MNKRLFKFLSGNIFIVTVFKIIGMLIPSQGKLKKYKNILIATYFIYRRKIKIKNNPISVLIAPISVCNYRCLFCEIHKDNLLFPNRPKNIVGLNVIKNYEAFLSTAYSLSFSGGSEEPLLNQDFAKIVEYLKLKYGTRMMVNTNASVLSKELSDTLVKYGFDSIVVSYHAGSKKAYKELMTGNIDRVDENLEYLKLVRERSKKEKPLVQFNFALQRLNAKEYPIVLKKAKQLGASAVIVNKYYGGRNRLQDKKVSYDYDIEQGNRVLDEIYAYAEAEGVKVVPAKCSRWVREEAEWDSENVDYSKCCTLPWTHLQFKPVLDDENCHYVGICNRIELFKIAYDKIEFKKQKQFEVLWNHPVLQYMRKTVNSISEINPICKYCKNRDREVIRNVDSLKYAAVRDQATREFFTEFRNQYNYSEIEGINVLSENPSSDEKFLEKLAEMEA
jgi:MoaA/NifB/PqqE/SkfB family radical SAM enzyme